MFATTIMSPIFFLLFSPFIAQSSTMMKKAEVSAEDCRNKVYEYYTNDTSINENNTLTLRSFCIYVKLPLKNCSCSSTPDLCCVERIIKSIQHDPGHYARENSFTLAYATETVFVSVLGTIGNALVLIFYLNQRCKLSSCKFHIAELAVVNLTFSAIQIVNAVPLYWTNTWIYPRPMCKIIRTLIEMGSFLTIVFILLISVERYVLIVHPLLTERGSIFSVEGKAKHITVAIGILLVLATVVPFWKGMGIERGSGRCVMFTGNARHMALPYNWFAVAAYCVIPACIMSFTYGRIITSHSKMTFFVEGRARMRKLKENKRIVRITISILGLFLICTLPSRILSIYIFMEDRFQMEEVNKNETSSLDMKLYLTLQFVAYVTFPLQCTLNPILYSMVDNEWRKCMRDGTKFTNKCFCQHDNEGGSSGSGSEKIVGHGEEIFTISRTQTKRLVIMHEVL